MTEPKFKPDSWVLFNLGSSMAFGRIKGGQINDGHWLYFITNGAQTGQSTYSIKEEDIVKEIVR